MSFPMNANELARRIKAANDTQGIWARLPKDFQKIACPVCQAAEMIASVKGSTEIWMCPECPMVLFTYYGSYGQDDLEYILGELNDN